MCRQDLATWQIFKILRYWEARVFNKLFTQNLYKLCYLWNLIADTDFCVYHSFFSMRYQCISVSTISVRGLEVFYLLSLCTITTTTKQVFVCRRRLSGIFLQFGISFFFCLESMLSSSLVFFSPDNELEWLSHDLLIRYLYHFTLLRSRGGLEPIHGWK